MYFQKRIINLELSIELEGITRNHDVNIECNCQVISISSCGCLDHLVKSIKQYSDEVDIYDMHLLRNFMNKKAKEVNKEIIQQKEDFLKYQDID